MPKKKKSSARSSGDRRSPRVQRYLESKKGLAQRWREARSYPKKTERLSRWAQRPVATEYRDRDYFDRSYTDTHYYRDQVRKLAWKRPEDRPIRKRSVPSMAKSLITSAILRQVHPANLIPRAISLPIGAISAICEKRFARRAAMFALNKLPLVGFGRGTLRKVRRSEFKC